MALIDISMPGWDGATLAEELTRSHPGVRIIAVTRHDDAEVLSLRSAGMERAGLTTRMQIINYARSHRWLGGAEPTAQD